MLRTSSGRNDVVAAISIGSLAGAIAVIFSVNVLSNDLLGTNPAVAEPAGTAASVNRARKADALPVPDTPQTRAEIKSVEVVGVRGASVVYRDREGNVLFQTDPLANVTVVVKNVELPEVTIRETETTEVKRIPAGKLDRTPQPYGCESAFARPSPESLTRMSSRCVTAIPGASAFAALQ